jgi:hypothetical protein
MSTFQGGQTASSRLGDDAAAPAFELIPEWGDRSKPSENNQGEL